MEFYLLLFYINFGLLAGLILASFKIKHAVIFCAQKVLFITLLILCIVNQFYNLFILLAYLSIRPRLFNYLSKHIPILKTYPLTLGWLSIALPLFLYSLTTSNLLLKFFLGINLIGILVLWKMGIDMYV